MRDEYDFENLNTRENPFMNRLKERIFFHRDRAWIELMIESNHKN